MKPTPATDSKTPLFYYYISDQSETGSTISGEWPPVTNQEEEAQRGQTLAAKIKRMLCCGS
jgi:hypothetical protein